MASNVTEEILKFVVKAQGADALLPFLESTKALETASEDTKKSADALLQKLAEATKLRALAASYDALTLSTEKLAQRSADADAKVAALAAEMTASQNPTREQQATLERAQRAAETLTKKLEEQRVTLTVYAAQMRQAGLSVGNAAQVQVELAAKSAAATKGLSELAAAAAKPAPEVNALTKAITAALGKLGEIADRARSAKVSFTELNQAAELAVKAINGLASVGRFFGDQAQDVGAYELALRRIEVRTRATTAESKALREAIAVALDGTAFSAQAAADAMRALADDGASATESANALGPALAYAQANAQGATETVQRLGAVLDAFDAPVAKVGELADQLTATAAAAGTSTRALEEGLSSVGNAAEQAGLSVGQTLELLGALAKRGVEGTQAGRQLAIVLRELADPASAAGEALRAAGLDSDNLAVAVRQLAQDSTATENVLSALGDRPREKLRLLLQDGGASLAAMAAAMDNATGATKRASDAVGDTFTLAWQKLQASIESARNTFLAPLLEPLTDRLQAFSDRVRAIATSNEFKALAEEIARFVESALVEVDKLLEGFDLQAAGESAKVFVHDTIEALQQLKEGLKGAADSGLNFKDGTIVAFEAARTGVAGSLASLVGAFANFSEEAETLSLVLAGIAEEARNNTGEAMARLADRIERARAAAAETARSADALATSMPRLSTAAAQTGPALDAFGNDLLQIGEKAAKLVSGPYSLEVLTGVASDAAAALAEIPKPATLLEGTFTNLEDALQAQIQTLRKAQAAYDEAFKAGSKGADEAWQAVKRAGSQVAELRKQIDTAKVSAADLSSAFKELGIQSQAALEGAARKGEEAFDSIVAAANRGQAAQQDVLRAFQEYAARLVATAEQADEATRAQIASQIELAGRIAGVRQAMIDTATASLRASETIASAGDQAAQSWMKVQTVAKGTGEAFEAAATTVEASTERIIAASDRTSESLQAQKGFVVELSDEWRAWADAIGVNVGAWDRLAKNAESATDRLVNASMLRRQEQEKAKVAAEELAQAEERLSAAQAGGLNFGEGGTGGGGSSGGSSGGGSSKASEIVLTVRNETNPNAIPARLTTDQMDQIARAVLAVIERDRRTG